MQKVLIIVGPTASGKSALGVELARRFNGEIISADSRQVYKGLDIGTGKITKREMQGVRHYLLDMTSAKKRFTADQFVKAAQRAAVEIIKRKKLPIVIGGTGFYIDALLGRVSLADVAPNMTLRKNLAAKSPEQLYSLLRSRDPKRAKSMNTPSERNNKVRLIRALEVAASSKGEPRPGKVEPCYDTLWMGINLPFKLLETKILKRLKSRMKLGMVAEARRLHKGGLSYKRMQELGLEYRSLARLLRNEITRQEFEAELFRDIRRYAKKQIGYWKRNGDITWVSASTDPRLKEKISAWLQT